MSHGLSGRWSTCPNGPGSESKTFTSFSCLSSPQPLGLVQKTSDSSQIQKTEDRVVSSTRRRSVVQLSVEYTEWGKKGIVERLNEIPFLRFWVSGR